MPRRMLAKSRSRRNTKSHRRRRATRKSRHFSRRRVMRGGVRDDLPTVDSVQGIPMPAGYMDERVDFPGGFMTLEEYRRALEKGSLHDATQ